LIRINAQVRSGRQRECRLIPWMALMNDDDSDFTIMRLADEMTEIARATTDAQTARRLMQLVVRLLEQAGLPSGDDEGGGEPPSSWVSDLADCPA
jgi:hypothetical protein